MFEEITFETILDRMMYRISDEFDKREGSLIYNALAPAAAELLQMYMHLDDVITESFALTASRDYLIKRAAERGIEPKAETFAIRKGEFNTEVPVGARFSLNELNYIVTEQIQPGVYKLQCETAGAVGNRESGQLIPIEYIEGLKTAALTEVLIPGQDEEETEIFRERYLNSFDSQAFGGNVTDYKEKVGYISGVGSVKVYPIWNGGGTVKLVILDSDFNVPSEVLIDRVQTIVDPTQNNGEGVGIAPIGHVVTVIGAQAKQINVSTNFTYQDGYSFSDIKQRAEQILEDYYKELSRQWAESGNLIVRISQIETRLLSLEGVVDIAETRINESSKNIQLEPDEIPIRGSLNDVQSLA